MNRGRLAQAEPRHLNAGPRFAHAPPDGEPLGPSGYSMQRAELSGDVIQRGYRGDWITKASLSELLAQ